MLAGLHYFFPVILSQSHQSFQTGMFFLFQQQINLPVNLLKAYLFYDESKENCIFTQIYN